MKSEGLKSHSLAFLFFVGPHGIDVNLLPSIFF